VKIAIIIPCWRDATALVKLVDRLRNASDTQWIAVLVNPDRSSVADLERKGVECLSFPRPNRGAQMNRGAQRATGDVLLFHHADSQLTVEHLESLREAMATSKAIGGAFYRKFDERHPRLRWAEPAEGWRCRHWGALFGDQSLFVRKEIFMQIGRFADIPLMEEWFDCLVGPTNAFFAEKTSGGRKLANHPPKFYRFGAVQTRNTAGGPSSVVLPTMRER